MERSMDDGQERAPETSAEEIRRRAYELYQARGGTGGSDMDDWLTAEREVRERGATAPMADRGATGVTAAAAGTEGAESAADALGGSAGGETARGGQGPSTKRSKRGR
jgi:hypothetical protein